MVSVLFIAFLKFEWFDDLESNYQIEEDYADQTKAVGHNANCFVSTH